MCVLVCWASGCLLVTSEASLNLWCAKINYFVAGGGFYFHFVEEPSCDNSGPIRRRK